MTDKNEKEFVILPAKSGSAYEGLRALWSDTFDDPPEFVDEFYENFGDDVTGFAMVDGDGTVCSALTCHICGEYMGKPVYVNYAICTRKDMRGRGLAAELTQAVRDEVTEAGGISAVSPAEPSLVQYYEKLGYEPYFFAAEKTAVSPDFDEEEFEDLGGLEEFENFEEHPVFKEFAPVFRRFAEGSTFGSEGSASGSEGSASGSKDFVYGSAGSALESVGSASESEGSSLEPGGFASVSEDADPASFKATIDLEPLTPKQYNEYREAFLAERPHIKPSDKMLQLMQAESLGGRGMYSVNRGDAICIIGSASPERVILTELIVNPVLQELSMDIDAEIASQVAKHFDAAEAVFITPGAGACQGMAYGLSQKSETSSGPENEALANSDDKSDKGHGAKSNAGPCIEKNADSAAESKEELFWEPYYGFPIP